MWDKIAMWSGVASIILAIVSIIIIFLTRENILDILDKDVILFDKNFELKKSAIEESLKLIDRIQEGGNSIRLDAGFTEQAKSIYNTLLCVVTDIRLADEFYNISLDTTQIITDARLAKYKLMCRKDIGLKSKHTKMLKRVETTTGSGENRVSNFNNTPNIVNPVYSTQPKPEQQFRPIQNPVQPQTQTNQTKANQPRPAQQPVRPRPVNSVPLNSVQSQANRRPTENPKK